MSVAIALVSPDSLLSDWFAGTAKNVEVSRSSAEFFQSFPNCEASVVVIDARGVLDGGHEANRMIDAVLESRSEAKIFVLTTGGVPEPLERRAAMREVILAENLNDLEHALQDRINADSSDQPEQISGIQETSNVSSSGGSTTNSSNEKNPSRMQTREIRSESRADGMTSEVVLQGVTRHFETNSSILKQMIEDLAVAAEHDVTILLIGETGSGKTFLSNLIHEASPRRAEPFLPLACGALPRDLIESELFGHVKGSFTSAHADKEGKFLAAGQGTILLDEIDVLGPEQQVKLLRVIETGEFEPVGSNRTYKSQARLVVASNLDLQPLVEAGRFRPDLYYRLNMLKFEIPPLRTRKVDIIPLARNFANRFQEKHSIRIDRIDDSFVESLLAYPWPGNVRELENVIQRAVIYCRDGILTRRHLPPHILSGEAGPTNDPSVQLGTYKTDNSSKTLENKVALTEREIIEQTLLKNNFSRTNTAKELGISRVTLYNKMKKYDMMK